MACLFFMQLLLVLLYVGTAGASRRNAAHSGEDASRRKARYYYSAGMVEQAQGNEDSAYEYFKKAYAADPGYAEAASAFGTRRLSIGLDTLQSDTELARSPSVCSDEPTGCIRSLHPYSCSCQRCMRAQEILTRPSNR